MNDTTKLPPSLLPEHSELSVRTTFHLAAVVPAASSSVASTKLLPRPLFDTLENLLEPLPSCVSDYLTAATAAITAAVVATPSPDGSSVAVLADTKRTPHTDYQLTVKFLASYSGSADTFTAYRREVERFLHWSWLIAHKPIVAIDRNDVRHYIDFSRNPPAAWIAVANAPRFIPKNGARIHNPRWRPFVAHVSKAQHKQGEKPERANYVLSNKSLAALLAVLSTYFTFLQQENYLTSNPVQLVRQKGQIIQKHQSHKITRKLSQLQWQYVIATIEERARVNPEYERHLFLLSLFYLLGLRISEVSATARHTPTMGDFAPDKHDRWWFTTVGKGNKVRDVAVPDALLAALKHYRSTYLNLAALPTRGENTPLLARQRGRGNLGTRQVRNLVQECFDLAIARLQEAGQDDAAQDLATATVHWLRHTAISADVEHRPREHVRDDAGHENASITDLYIDIDRAARHDSARDKKLKPEPEEGK